MPKNRKGETFDARVYRILNCPRSAKYQDSLGAYGKRQRISLKHFEHHLRGLDSLALSAIDGGKANFLAIDIDKRFEERLSVFADILADRNLEKAAFAISGSGPGRGKVVITLATRLPQRQAVRLVQDVAEDAKSHVLFGSYKPSDLTSFPLGGEGAM